ncbi:hypothetical protein [Roseicyclus marinus]|uniref:hypothetical protein n=1 Tax=Roseicyclus marinus TaxID=2161673 RepID=UPI00240F64B3|nr:hypothetical protein [Roseicyclus marinus]MDG3042930.1 hypothetical protein [Roseicyclus marinus]
MRHAFACAVCLLMPGIAAAQDFSGRYHIDSCATGHPEGAMTIAGDRADFYESTCRLTNPVAVRDMGDATLFDMVCTGEGESWSFRALLMRGQDGLVFVREGQGGTYARCN